MVKREVDMGKVVHALRLERFRRGEPDWKQVAAEAGVTGATLSRVLSGADRTPPHKPSLDVMLSLMCWMGETDLVRFAKQLSPEESHASYGG